MRPNQTFHVLETLRNLSSVPLIRKGVELSLDDSHTVTDVYLQWLLLMVDLGYLKPEALERTARRLWIDMIHADVYELNGAFAECVQLVRLQSSRGFKGLCARISTHLYNLVKADMDAVLRGDVEAARRLIQAFSWTSRLSLSDIDLTQQLLEEYLAVEEKIPQSYPSDLTDALNKIIRRWLGPFQPSEVHPHHSSGGTAEFGRIPLQTKYFLLASDKRLSFAFGDPWWVTCLPPKKLERQSTTIFVPKSYKTFRTISMEPTTLMYFQQGVWDVLDRQVAHNGYLRNRIGFHDQTRNTQLARRGSIERSFATIDLSSASDSVGYDLVKKLFRGTWLLRYIVTTRSTHTKLPDERVVALRKFAPMGSALCFPVETIVFASLCEYVTRGYHVNGQYSVFGDDIIVPTQCAESVMTYLEALGFRVNHDKSFYQESCWFRESCGGEFCDGFDVTPLRVSRKYASRERDVRLAKLVQLSNNAYKRDFRCLRYFFIAKLREEHCIPLFSETEMLGDNYTNYHTIKRWNRRLQRIECRVTTSYTKYTASDLSSQDEGIRYRHWLESTYERKTLGDGFQSVICRPMVQFHDSWRMKPYESSDQAFIDRALGEGGIPVPH